MSASSGARTGCFGRGYRRGVPRRSHGSVRRDGPGGRRGARKAEPTEGGFAPLGGQETHSTRDGRFSGQKRPGRGRAQALPLPGMPAGDPGRHRASGGLAGSWRCGRAVGRSGRRRPTALAPVLLASLVHRAGRSRGSVAVPGARKRALSTAPRWTRPSPGPAPRPRADRRA